MSSFRNLYVFRLALQLMRMVYRETASFPKHELYGLTSQLRRAVISVLSNIAEGEGRVTAGEKRNLLSQARGSLFEVEAQVIAAQDLGYLSRENAAKLDQQIARVGKALVGYIRFVDEQPPRILATSNPRVVNAAQKRAPQSHPESRPRTPPPPPSSDAET